MLNCLTPTYFQKTRFKSRLAYIRLVLTIALFIPGALLYVLIQGSCELGACLYKEIHNSMSKTYYN